jgi:CheY-like chemotaxis protein
MARHLSGQATMKPWRQQRERKDNVPDAKGTQPHSNKVLLYVEDDEGFVDLFRHLLKQGAFKTNLVRLTNGEEAISYFKGEGIYSDRVKFPLPDLALIDLKMPRVNGFELLHWIREQSEFPTLPVIVLTVSEDVDDIRYAYQLGANSFLIKPPVVAELQEILNNLDKEWFRHNLAASSRLSLPDRRG